MYLEVIGIPQATLNSFGGSVLAFIGVPWKIPLPDSAADNIRRSVYDAVREFYRLNGFEPKVRLVFESKAEVDRTLASESFAFTLFMCPPMAGRGELELLAEWCGIDGAVFPRPDGLTPLEQQAEADLRATLDRFQRNLGYCPNSFSFDTEQVDTGDVVRSNLARVLTALGLQFRDRNEAFLVRRGEQRHVPGEVDRS